MTTVYKDMIAWRLFMWMHIGSGVFITCVRGSQRFGKYAHFHSCQNLDEIDTNLKSVIRHIRSEEKVNLALRPVVVGRSFAKLCPKVKNPPTRGWQQKDHSWSGWIPSPDGPLLHFCTGRTNKMKHIKEFKWMCNSKCPPTVFHLHLFLQVH